jgi:hypothetical protein
MSFLARANIQTGTQKIVIQQLKEHFKECSTYLYSDSFATTEIGISLSFPKRMVKYPHIFVGDVTGPALLRTIGGEFQYVMRGERIISGVTISNAVCGVVFGGGFHVTVPIFVAGQTSYDRRIVIDEITMAIRRFRINELAAEGLHLRDIRLGSASEEEIGNEYIYMDTLDLDFYTEWKQVVFDTPLISRIDGLSISCSTF